MRRRWLTPAEDACTASLTLIDEKDETENKSAAPAPQVPATGE
jgi:hypothetical protein